MLWRHISSPFKIKFPKKCELVYKCKGIKGAMELEIERKIKIPRKPASINVIEEGSFGENSDIARETSKRMGAFLKSPRN
jgi:hypothetical protein